MKQRLSEVDENFEIDEDSWVLTLARKPHSAHPQHAFFILEGIEDGKASIWFMDLVGPGLAPKLPNILDAHIRIENIQDGSEDELKRNPLLYRCQRIMMDLQGGETIMSRTWNIEKEDADRLIDAMKQDKLNPPVFNIFGKNSIITGSSASSSSKERGHNCFTYCREKIENLNVSIIRIESDEKAYCIDHIAGISSTTLNKPKTLTRLKH